MKLSEHRQRGGRDGSERPPRRISALSIRPSSTWLAARIASERQRETRDKTLIGSRSRSSPTYTGPIGSGYRSSAQTDSFSTFGRACRTYLTCTVLGRQRRG